MMEQAACLGHDPHLWDTSTRDGHTARFGSVRVKDGRMPRQRQIALAKAICASCPVITLCLTLGMKEEEGIWGGKLPDERWTS